MERIKKIQHHGKEIIYVDHRGLKDLEVVENLRLANKNILTSPTKVLVISDYSGVFATLAIMEELKSPAVKKVILNSHKQAVLGIAGVKRILLNTFNSLTGGNVRAFKLLQEAMDYVVSD